ncbi:acid protease [Amylocystis lapponica]|nr:acid protease [Amylocystis lapponica]
MKSKLALLGDGSCLFSLAAVVPSTASKVTLNSRRASQSHRSASLQRRLSAASIPLKDQYSGTDLQWYGEIAGATRTVGTPPQTLTTVFDTGSSTLEFASTLCSACFNQTRFDPNASSTYVDGGYQTTITFETGGNASVAQGDEYQITLRNATDTVSVGGLTASDVPLYLFVNQTSAFDSIPYSGILGETTSSSDSLVGLASEPDGYWAAVIKEGLPALFGMYLTPERVGNAELTLGGYDTSKIKGPVTYANMPDEDLEGAWILASPGIAVNGQTTPLLQTSRQIIFDSGTTNAYFDTNITEAIYSLISPDILPYAPEPGAYYIACDKVASLPATIDIAFTAASGAPFNLTIPSRELNVGAFPGNTTYCQTAINALDGLELVGGILLKYYYAIYDVDAQRIGFASNVAPQVAHLKLALTANIE